jgi:hypothetical protein
MNDLPTLLEALTAQPLLEGDFRVVRGAEDATDEFSELRFSHTATVPYLDVRRTIPAVLAGDVVLWIRSPIAKKRLGDRAEALAARWLVLAANGARIRVVSPRRSIGVLTVHSGKIRANAETGLPADLGHLIEVTATSDAVIAEVDYQLEHRADAYQSLPLLADPNAVPEHWHLRDPTEIAAILLDSLATPSET